MDYEKKQPTADCIVARLAPSWGSRVSLLFKVKEPYEHYYDENWDEVPYEAIVSWTDVELPPESEDERIRKGLIHHLKELREWKAGTMSPIKVKEHYDAWIAWLEKQKEQKPSENISQPTVQGKGVYKICPHCKERMIRDDSKVYTSMPPQYGYNCPKCGAMEFDTVIYDNPEIEEQKPNIELIQRSWYMEGYHDGKFEMEPMWNLKTGKGGPRYEKNERYGQPLERKPAEWSEDWREEDIQTRFAFYTYKDDPSVLYLSNVFVEETSRNHGFGTRILRATEKVAETLGIITIRLKVKQESPANAWYRKHGYGYMTFEDGYDWLEKTLEYLKPSKQEWSEYDQHIIERIKDSINIAKSISSHAGKCYDEELDWLKSLKNRGSSPKSNTNSLWKPSKEQIDCLVVAASGYGNSEVADVLNSLINDLKKL